MILASVFFAAAMPSFGAPLPPPPVLGPKPFGVLVLGEGQAPQWSKTAEDVQDAFSGEFPVEFAFGRADPTSMRRAVQGLEAGQVEKIVVVPLFFSKQEAVMKENRYLLGVEAKPSRLFFKSPQSEAVPSVERLAIGVPVVLMPTLDFSPAFSAVLSDHAESKSRNPRDETVVLIGESPREPRVAAAWQARLEAEAEALRVRVGFKKSAAFLVEEGFGQSGRDRSESRLRRRLRALRLRGPVLVLSSELAPDLLTARLPRIADGLLIDYDARPLLPDPRIVAWVGKAARSGARLSDMRRFKAAPAASASGL